MISDLLFWEDKEKRSPSQQMAVDEVLLLHATVPVIRFYRWTMPCVTFGYAQKYATVLALAGARAMIRRWTGGGIVFHGEDLTIALAVPHGHALAKLPSALIYRRIHESFLSVIRLAISDARLAGTEDCIAGPACFQSPAVDDLLSAAGKICGGALRRGKKGVLYQGSLHGHVAPADLAHSLCSNLGEFQPSTQDIRAYIELAEGKYATHEWNHLR